MAGELLTLDEQFFLRIALKNELISQADADECLRLRGALARRGKRKPLQEIMLDTGLLTPEEVDEIHEAQNASQVVRLDSLYADGALKLGLTTREHLQEAFAEQRARRYQVRVGELLVDRGVITSAQHREVLMELLLSMKAEEKAYIQGLRLKKRLGAAAPADAGADGEPPMSEAERIKSAMTEVGWRAPGAGASPTSKGASGAPAAPAPTPPSPAPPASAPTPPPPPAPTPRPAPPRAPEPAPTPVAAPTPAPPASKPIPPRPVRPPPGTRPASGAFPAPAPPPAPAPELAPTAPALPMAPPQAAERPPSRPAPGVGVGGAVPAAPSRAAPTPTPPPPSRPQPQLPTVFAAPPAGAASRGATAFDSSSEVDLSLFDSRSDAISDDDNPAAPPAAPAAASAKPPSGPLALLGPGSLQPEGYGEGAPLPARGRLVDSHGSDDFLADSADEESRIAIAPLPARGASEETASAAARESVQQWLGLDTVAGDSSSEVPKAKGDPRRRPSSDDELPESFFASNVLAVKEEGRRSRDPDDDAEVEPLLPPPPVSTPLPFVPAPAPTSLAQVPEPSLAPRTPSGRKIDAAYGAPPPRASGRAPAVEEKRPPRERERREERRDEKPRKKDSGRQKAQGTRASQRRASGKKADPARLLESAIETFDEQSAAATATAAASEAQALASPDVQQVESDLTEVEAMIKAGAPSFSSLKARRPSGERASAFSTEEYLKRKASRERTLRLVLVALVIFVIAPTGAALWFAHENRALAAEAREALARGDYDAAQAAADAAGPFWIGERALERLRREVAFRRALSPVVEARDRRRFAEALDRLRAVRDDHRDFGAETSALEAELTLAGYLDQGEKAEAEGDLAKAVASYEAARRAAPARAAEAEKRIALVRARLEKDVEEALASQDLERQVEAYRRVHAVFGGREEELGRKVLAFDLTRYLAQGDAASRDRDYEKALGFYYKAGEAARDLSSAEAQREVEEKTRAARRLASFQGYFNKGQAAEAKGKLDDALQSYRSALTWIEKGDTGRAQLVQQRIEATEKRKTREGVDAEAGRLWTEAVQALQQGRTDAAVAALEALKLVKPDHDRVERAIAFAREVADMVYVPAGECRMGTKAGAAGVKKEETPEHTVALPAFFVDRYETRNRSYLPFVEATGERRPEQWSLDRGEGKVKGFAPEYADHPVVNVSWDDASKFAAWAKKRLPTEEEWERAARGSDGRAFPWGDAADGAKANIGARISERVTIQTRPVGTSQGDVSPCGAVDMGGNVSEWTASPWAPYPGSEAEAGKFDAEKRVIRGGSWRYAAGYARCANRDASKPSERYPETGFRCVKEIPEWLTELR